MTEQTPIPISELPEASTITGNEATVMVQDNTTVRAPVSQLPQGFEAGVVVYGNTGGAPFPNFRTLTAGTGVTLTDSGEQSDLTISLTRSIIGTDQQISVSGGAWNDDVIISLPTEIIFGDSNTLSNSANGGVLGGNNSVVIGSDDSVVVGGANHNINNSPYSSLVAGRNNTITDAISDCGIFAGSNNIISAGTYNSISGGRDHSISSSTAAILGGNGNTISTSGQYASIAGGKLHLISAGDGGAILGGYSNTVSASYAIAHGRQAVASHYGQSAHGGTRFSADGDAQASRFVVKASTTNNTQTEMLLGDSSRLTMANDTTWTFDALITARRTDADNESAGYRIIGVIDNNANTVALVGSVTVTTIGEDTSAWDVTAQADNTNKALVFKVTGENAKTIRWVGHVQTVEVTG